MHMPRVPPHVLGPLVAVVTLPVGILSLLFVNFEVSVAVFVVGWFLLTPVLAILGNEIEWDSETADSTEQDPIETLRDRYAAGEIDEAELERRLDALLEMEELDHEDQAAIEAARHRLDTDRGTELEREAE